MMYFSTVEMDISEKTRVIRQYKKSSIPRLRWTPDLHEHFVKVVHGLGGKYKATPKKIMQMMGVKGLKISHIKSHLQMYRSMRETTTSSNEFIGMKYQENGPNLRRLICEGLRETSSHGKIVRVPLTAQARIVTQKGTKVIYHDYKGARGRSTGKTIREDRTSHEINFLGLNDHQISDQSSNHINLELTIS